MASNVVFTPLSGADAASPLAYLLQLGDFVILLDAGWDDAFDESSLAALAEAVPRVDAVLLSHPDVEHLGALPRLVCHLGLEAPVYATLPVHRMGRLALRDVCLSHQSEADFAAFSLADIDTAFDRVTELRWRQSISLQGKGAGISITPHAAGRLVGGSIWHISFHGEDLVYAVDTNHRKERLLNGTPLEAIVHRPALLVTDAYNAAQMQPRTLQWEADLINLLKATLRGDGKVLIAADAAGRVLELVLALERAWEREKLPYPLALLNPVARAVVEHAKTQLEWLSDGLQRSFEATRDNPFALRHVRVLQRVEDLDNLPPGGAVVLASLPSLAAGASRRLFADWAADERNLVVFPGSCTVGSLAAEALAASRSRGSNGGAAPQLRFPLSRRVPLEGQELLDFEATQEQADDQEPEDEKAAAPTPARISSGKIARVGSRSARHTTATDSAAAAGDAAADQSTDAAAAQQQHVEGATAGRNVLVEGFTVPEGAVAPMFPVEDEWEGVEWDDYGAAIDPADFGPHDDTAAEAMDVGTQPAEQLPDVQGPTKVVVEDVTLSLRAKVVELPGLEGRTDGRSQRTIIGHIAPRHLVLVRGTPEAKAGLTEHCHREQASLHTAVHVPDAGAAIDVSAGLSTVRVGLAQQLAMGVRLQKVGDYHLGWVAGILGPTSKDGSPLELLPAANGSAISSSQGGVFIGDVRLSDLKRALGKAGLASDWEGPGALVAANGMVRVRLAPQDGAADSAAAATANPDANALLLEGALCPEYYAVRNLLYDQYHLC